MRLDPPLRDAPRYPLTSAVALAAVGLSLYAWSGHDTAALLPTPALSRRPWTLITSALLHADPLHLAFNLCWWWFFGTRIEAVWGRLPLAAISLVLAATSAAAEYAFFGAGVGLSGVCYGLFGLLMVARRRIPAFAGAVSTRTMQLFTVWFVLCIILTSASVLRVGNVAHAAGALTGAAIGACVVAAPVLRPAWVGATALLVAASFVGATVARPWINLSHGPSANAFLGVQALTADRPQEALPLLEAAAREQPRNSAILINLGIAYQKLARYDDALASYKRALVVDPSKTARLIPTLVSITQHQAHDALDRDDNSAALAKIDESLRWRPSDEYSLRQLATVRARSGDLDGAISACEHARAVADPVLRDSPKYRRELAEQLGIFHANAGHHDLAAAQFREGLAADPDDGNLWLLLGQELQHLGATDEALSAYLRAAASPELKDRANAAASALSGRAK